MACKKKLHQLNPDHQQKAPYTIQQTRREKKDIKVNPQSNERYIREVLAHKLSGTHLGLWLLIPEYLRLGAWDLLTGLFAQGQPQSLAPRLGLQLVNEAALCVNRLRSRGSLCNQGFSLVNGLSFLAADETIHSILDSHGIIEYEQLQVALLKIRRLQKHYDPQNILALDPHRIASATGRIMPKKKKKPEEPAIKSMQVFFCVDMVSGQPLAFTIGSSGKTCSKATIHLINLLQHGGVENALLVADKEHFTQEIAHYLYQHPSLDILMPVPVNNKVAQCIPVLDYKTLWAGYAIAQTIYQFEDSPNVYKLLVQREGENPKEYTFMAFLTTSKNNPVDLLTLSFPKRWTIEEFFNFEGDMAWNRASTFNLNIRYGKQSLALLAQAATHQLKNKLPKPYRQWTAKHFADQVLTNMEGDIRVKDDTIIVTYYHDHLNLGLQPFYQNLPSNLVKEGINPRIPWLLDFKLDFRFK
jgi:hypothetical protein